MQATKLLSVSGQACLHTAGIHIGGLLLVEAPHLTLIEAQISALLLMSHSEIQGGPRNSHSRQNKEQKNVKSRFYVLFYSSGEPQCFGGWWGEQTGG